MYQRQSSIDCQPAMVKNFPMVDYAPSSFMSPSSFELVVLDEARTENTHSRPFSNQEAEASFRQLMICSHSAK